MEDYGELFKVNKKSKINLAFTVGKYVQTVFWGKEWYCIFQTYQAHTLTHQVSIAPQAVELMVDRSKTRSWKKNQFGIGLKSWEWFGKEWLQNRWKEEIWVWAYFKTKNSWIFWSELINKYRKIKGRQPS